VSKMAGRLGHAQQFTDSGMVAPGTPAAPVRRRSSGQRRRRR